jgi:hypothetical protein
MARSSLPENRSSCVNLVEYLQLEHLLRRGWHLFGSTSCSNQRVRSPAAAAVLRIIFALSIGSSFIDPLIRIHIKAYHTCLSAGIDARRVDAEAGTSLHSTR